MIIIVLYGCASDKHISKGSVSQATTFIPSEQGLWYYLPKTVIKIEIIAEKEVAKAGPFFRFSQRFLNISDVITEDKEIWSITGANVYTEGIPDDKKLFKVSTEGIPAIAALSLTKDGVLKSVNIPQPSIFHGCSDIKQTEKEIITLKSINFNDVQYSEEQLIKSSTTAMAEEVAKEIYRLRQLKSRIVKGEVDSMPPDGGSFEKTLSEIEKMEQAYMSLFIGKVEKQTVKRVFEFIPDGMQNMNTVLLRFSQQKGFVDIMDVSGTPVYIEVEVNTNNAKNFLLDENKKTENKEGLVVCNPTQAKVRIIDRTLLLTENKVFLGQFGQMYRLPKDLLNDSNVGILLDETTGAVKEIKLK